MERRKYHKRELHEGVQAYKTLLAGAIARRLKINGAADQHDTDARMSALYAFLSGAQKFGLCPFTWRCEEGWGDR